MGRAIRRVPPGWDHPRYREEQILHGWQRGEYHPLFDQSFAEAAREWLDDCIAWDNGTHATLIEHPEYKEESPFFWQYDGDPPDPEYYRPDFGENATWLQVYETVSEGTPVTPAFATKEEIIEYLVKYGDFSDQRDGEGGWLRESAERFVKSEWTPSMIMAQTDLGVVIQTPRNMTAV